MICAIHQPQYMPWLGYFDKIDRADVFVFLDTCQFKKNEWQNRNRIKTVQDWQWLTVPVSHNFGQEIRHVLISNASNWRRKHQTAIQSNYAKAPYFQTYRPMLQGILEREWTHLAELNVHLVKVLADCLGIRTRWVLASEMHVEGRSTEAIVDLTRMVGADTYLSGAGGHEYLDTSRFGEEGIQLQFQHYDHPVYPQIHGEFKSHLSVIDLLLNCGPDSLAIIRRGRGE